MAITTRPLLPYSSFSFWVSGSPLRHGGHQVAQKSRRTTFPFRLESDTVLPFILVTCRLGAGDPRETGGLYSCCVGMAIVFMPFGREVSKVDAAMDLLTTRWV